VKIASMTSSARPTIAVILAKGFVISPTRLLQQFVANACRGGDPKTTP